MESDEQEHRGWYESWLDDIAGKRVSVLPLFLAWCAICGPIGCVSLLLFGGTEAAFFTPFGVASFVYWFLAVPQWVRHRAESTHDEAQ